MKKNKNVMNTRNRNQ